MSENDKKPWLTPNVWGMSITSLLSDASHEIATSIFPLFFAALSISPAILGIIEGTADGLSSASKLIFGWLGDRIKRRKPVVVCGYAITALSVGAFAFAASWPFIMASRVVGWMARGARGPLKDTLLSESIPADSQGKAFGFERAGDTVGAILGPLAALLFIRHLAPQFPSATLYRWIFLFAMIPGLLSATTFGLFVSEKQGGNKSELNMWRALQALPHAYRRYLLGVGLHGAGDFARTLLILRAAQILTPGMGSAKADAVAIGLYVLHNIIYAAMSYPVGALGDRLQKKTLLAAAYILAAAVDLGLVLRFQSTGYLALIFALCGLYTAAMDTLEKAIAAELLPGQVKSTGFGVLATINGIGDFVSSFMVGLLWTKAGAAFGFGYAAVLTFSGGVVVWLLA